MAAYYARCCGEDADDLTQEAWAGLLEALKMSASDLNAAFAWGLAASFLSGVAAIGLFLAWLKKRGLTPFLVYRVALGAAMLWLFWGYGK